MHFYMYWELTQLIPFRKNAPFFIFLPKAKEIKHPLAPASCAKLETAPRFLVYISENDHTICLLCSSQLGDSSSGCVMPIGLTIRYLPQPYHKPPFCRKDVEPSNRRIVNWFSWSCRYSSNSARKHHLHETNQANTFFASVWRYLEELFHERIDTWWTWTWYVTSQNKTPKDASQKHLQNWACPRNRSNHVRSGEIKGRPIPITSANLDKSLPWKADFWCTREWIYLDELWYLQRRYVDLWVCICKWIRSRLCDSKSLLDK